jgi:hypothetical protein
MGRRFGELILGVAGIVGETRSEYVVDAND